MAFENITLFEFDIEDVSARFGPKGRTEETDEDAATTTGESIPPDADEIESASSSNWLGRLAVLLTVGVAVAAGTYLKLRDSRTDVEDGTASEETDIDVEHLAEN